MAIADHTEQRRMLRDIKHRLRNVDVDMVLLSGVLSDLRFDSKRFAIETRDQYDGFRADRFAKIHTTSQWLGEELSKLMRRVDDELQRLDRLP